MARAAARCSAPGPRPVICAGLQTPRILVRRCLRDATSALPVVCDRENRFVLWCAGRSSELLQWPMADLSKIRDLSCKRWQGTEDIFLREGITILLGG